MGKTAENEKIKYRATFFNNTAVGLMVAGVFLPLVAVYGHIPEFAPKPDSDLGMLAIKWFFTFLPSGVAFLAAQRMHTAAISLLDKVED